nr:high-affinity methionine permease [Quercus suber]
MHARLRPGLMKRDQSYRSRDYIDLLALQKIAYRMANARVYKHHTALAEPVTLLQAVSCSGWDVTRSRKMLERIPPSLVRHMRARKMGVNCDDEYNSSDAASIPIGRESTYIGRLGSRLKLVLSPITKGMGPREEGNHAWMYVWMRRTSARIWFRPLTYKSVPHQIRVRLHEMVAVAARLPLQQGLSRGSLSSKLFALSCSSWRAPTVWVVKGRRPFMIVRPAVKFRRLSGIRSDPCSNCVLRIVKAIDSAVLHTPAAVLGDSCLSAFGKGKMKASDESAGSNGTSESSSLLPRTSSVSHDPGYQSLSDVERRDSALSTIKYSPADVENDVVPETSTLRRNLNWSSAYILTISRVLGSGIFATPGVILASVGSPGLSLCLWIVGAILAYCGLTVVLEFGSMLPRSGGEKVYLEFTYRRPRYLVSILAATLFILLGFTASNCIVFAQYLLFVFGTNGNEFVRKAIAVGLLTSITLVHACFVKTGIRIQNMLGWIKIALLVFMILSGMFVVLIRQDERDSSSSDMPFTTSQFDWSWNGLWAGTIWSWGAIATSILKVFYSFAGLNNITNVMNEVKDPKRTLKSVALTALATACSVYLLINIAYFSVVPLEEVKSGGELIAALFFERVFGQDVGRKFLPMMVALGCMGNVMVVTYALARLNQEIARTGLIPFSKILSSNAPFGSPLGGLILHYIPSILVITIPTGDIYSLILEVEGYPAQILSFATGFGLIWLRYKRADLHRPYKAWIPAIVTHMGFAGALILAPFFPSKAQSAKGVLGGAAYALIGIAVRGYRLEDQTHILEDGTTITKVAQDMYVLSGKEPSAFEPLPARLEQRFRNVVCKLRNEIEHGIQARDMTFKDSIKNVRQ